MKMKNGIICLLLCFCISISCKNKLQKVNTKLDKSSLDTEKADSVTLVYSNNGYRKAVLQAKTFVHETQGSQPFVEMKDGLQINILDADNKVTSHITSNRGRYFEKNNNVLLRDSVKIINAKKEVLTTDELIWNEESKLFFTEKMVTIVTATQMIIGDGMEANQDFSRYKIFNPHGVIAVKKAGLPQ